LIVLGFCQSWADVIDETYQQSKALSFWHFHSMGFLMTLKSCLVCWKSFQVFLKKKAVMVRRAWSFIPQFVDWCSTHNSEKHENQKKDLKPKIRGQASEELLLRLASSEPAQQPQVHLSLYRRSHSLQSVPTNWIQTDGVPTR